MEYQYQDTQLAQTPDIRQVQYLSSGMGSDNFFPRIRIQLEKIRIRILLEKNTGPDPTFNRNDEKKYLHNLGR